MGDDDIYSALVGGAPTDKTRQMALANSLRNKDLQGQVYSLTDDPTISAYGKGQLKAAMEGGQDVQQSREAQATLAETQEYRRAQAAQAQAALAETRRWHNMVNDISQQKVDTAADKADAGKPIPQADRKQLEAMGTSISGIQNSLSNFKDSYAGTMLPGGRPLANTLSRMGVNLTSNQQDASDWFSDYNRSYSLPALHAQFGARLTPPELAKFDAAHIGENMNPDQIRGRLTSVLETGKGGIARYLDDLEGNGFSPKAIATLREQYGVARGMGAPTSGGVTPQGTLFPATRGGGSGPPPAAVPSAGGAGAAGDSYLQRLRQQQMLSLGGQ
jgi:hypothetical protein